MQAIQAAIVRERACAVILAQHRRWVNIKNITASPSDLSSSDPICYGDKDVLFIEWMFSQKRFRVLEGSMRSGRARLVASRKAGHCCTEDGPPSTVRSEVVADDIGHLLHLCAVRVNRDTVRSGVQYEHSEILQH